jgi:hypothetical protein
MVLIHEGDRYADSERERKGSIYNEGEKEKGR